MSNKYVEVHFDSSYFETGGNNDVPRYVFDTQLKNIRGLQVLSAELPFSYYVFDSQNCTITISLGGGAATTYTLAVGNYTVSEWISQMAILVPAITITYSPITNKLTFTAAQTITITFDANGMNDMIGFNVPGQASFGGTTTVTSPNGCNFSGPNYIVVHCNLGCLLQQRLLTTSPTNLANSNNVIGHIPVNRNRNDVIYYECPTNHYFDIDLPIFNYIEFYFTLGKRLTPMSFNGVPVSLKLGLIQYDDTRIVYNSRGANIMRA